VPPIASARDCHAHDDLPTAIRDAFTAAWRQVQEYVRKHDGTTRRRAAE
jgi:hypothetical protein